MRFTHGRFYWAHAPLRRGRTLVTASEWPSVCILRTCFAFTAAFTGRCPRVSVRCDVARRRSCVEHIGGSSGGLLPSIVRAALAATAITPATSAPTSAWIVALQIVARHGWLTVLLLIDGRVCLRDRFHRGAIDIGARWTLFAAPRPIASAAFARFALDPFAWLAILAGLAILAWLTLRVAVFTWRPIFARWTVFPRRALLAIATVIVPIAAIVVTVAAAIITIAAIVIPVTAVVVAITTGVVAIAAVVIAITAILRCAACWARAPRVAIATVVAAIAIGSFFTTTFATLTTALSTAFTATAALGPLPITATI